jgi:hypothetical protein
MEPDSVGSVDPNLNPGKAKKGITKNKLKNISWKVGCLFLEGCVLLLEL